MLRINRRKFHPLRNKQEINSAAQVLKMEFSMNHLEILNREADEVNEEEETAWIPQASALENLAKHPIQASENKTTGASSLKSNREGQNIIFRETLKNLKKHTMEQNNAPVVELPKPNEINQKPANTRSNQAFRNDRICLTTDYFPKQNVTDFMEFYNDKNGLLKGLETLKEEEGENEEPGDSEEELDQFNDSDKALEPNGIVWKNRDKKDFSPRSPRKMSLMMNLGQSSLTSKD